MPGKKAAAKIKAKQQQAVQAVLDDAADKAGVFAGLRGRQLNKGSGPQRMINESDESRDSSLKPSSIDPKAYVKSLSPIPYEVKRDTTLKDSQRAVFANSDTNFRSDSNPTTLLFSTGYHEAVVTTDMYTYLKKASIKKGDMQLSNSTNSKLIGDFKGILVSQNVLKSLLKLGDGFRTDTAQTILSGPKGTAAGHSGSNLSTKGQASAHDLLRAVVLKVLKNTTTQTKGYSERALATLMGAVTVTSIAPGIVARSLEHTGNIKDYSAPERWEKDRNEMKARVNTSFVELNQDEQKFVLDYAKVFIDSIEDTNRELDVDKPFSPVRDSAFKGGGKAILGGDYVHGSIDSPKLSPPLDVQKYGYYITQVKRQLRPQRRGALKSPSPGKKINRD